MSKREGTFLVQLFALSSKIGQNWTKKKASWTKGYYSYEKDVDLAKLEAKFKEVFNDQDLALDKRVVYIHGVPADLELSESVGGKINDHYDQHVTLPIAAGKINRID
jgi:hypothetical protein